MTEAPGKRNVTGWGEGSTIYIAHADSPVRVLILTNTGGAILSGLWIDRQKYDHALLKEETIRECGADSLAIFRRTARWLKLYFSGQGPNFYPRLSFSGSELRKEIAWKMLSVPYGRTTSYKQLAEGLTTRQGKNYVSPHATGGTVAYNPLLILIPCHRIIGADGRLTDCAGGLERKRYLLALEAEQL